jgi:hypothetical protein
VVASGVFSEIVLGSLHGTLNSVSDKNNEIGGCQSSTVP